MPTLIRLSGPYGYVLTLLALVVLFVTLRATRSLMTSTPPSPSVVREQQNALLFWGSVAAMIGFLGQCTGSYLALTAILEASEISPSVVAEGFVTSFVPTLFGLAILAFSVAAWGCLRLLAQGRPTLIRAGGPLVFLLLLSLVSCAQTSAGSGPGTLGDGVWVMEAGPDRFLWDFTEGTTGLSCVVHDVAGERKVNETPCLRAEKDGSGISVAMDTGVRLEGEVDLSRGRISGHLLYPDGSEMEVEFPWHPADDFPELFPLPAGKDPYAYQAPTPRGDGWGVASAQDVGVDPAALEGMVKSVARGEAGVLHSLLVARHGRLVLEEYFHGYGPDELHPLASCTKSVSSLLVGAAIQEGAIGSVSDAVLEYLPEYREGIGTGWNGLTLEHLLTMSMALDWSPREAETAHGTGPEFFRRVLSHSVVGTPGRDWAYVNANVNLLAGVLYSATGVQAESFAEKVLFRPLGISTWDWEGMKTDGFNLMDGSLRLVPRDMAKIGQMVLDGGRWEGREVLPEAWIRASTQRYLDAGQGGEGYGYLWWLMDARIPGSQDPVPAIFANGWGSQFIAVFPSLDLVVVTTGGNDFNGKHMAVAAGIGRYLLPGVSVEEG